MSALFLSLFVVRLLAHYFGMFYRFKLSRLHLDTQRHKNIEKTAAGERSVAEIVPRGSFLSLSYIDWLLIIVLTTVERQTKAAHSHIWGSDITFLV